MASSSNDNDSIHFRHTIASTGVRAFFRHKCVVSSETKKTGRTLKGSRQVFNGQNLIVFELALKRPFLTTSK